MSPDVGQQAGLQKFRPRSWPEKALNAGCLLCVSPDKMARGGRHFTQRDHWVTTQSTGNGVMWILG